MSSNNIVICPEGVQKLNECSERFFACHVIIPIIYHGMLCKKPLRSIFALRTIFLLKALSPLNKYNDHVIQLPQGYLCHLLSLGRSDIWQESPMVYIETFLSLYKIRQTLKQGVLYFIFSHKCHQWTDWDIISASTSQNRTFWSFMSLSVIVTYM